MFHQPYPTPDVECVTTLIDIGRRGAVREEIRDFAKCSYVLGGGLLKVTVGEPDDVIVGSEVTQVGAAQPAEATAEQLQECYDYVVAAGPELEAYAASSEADVTAINPALAAVIKQLALLALEYFLSRKGG